MTAMRLMMQYHAYAEDGNAKTSRLRGISKIASNVQ